MLAEVVFFAKTKIYIIVADRTREMVDFLVRIHAPKIILVYVIIIPLYVPNVVLVHLSLLLELEPLEILSNTSQEIVFSTRKVDYHVFTFLYVTLQFVYFVYRLFTKVIIFRRVH